MSTLELDSLEEDVAKARDWIGRHLWHVILVGQRGRHQFVDRFADG